MSSNDDWLDAFSPEDLDDPVFERIDEAVREVPHRTRRRWPLLLVPLAVAAAALFWAARPMPTSTVAPPQAQVIEVVDVGPMLHAPRLVLGQEQSAVDDALDMRPAPVAQLDPSRTGPIEDEASESPLLAVPVELPPPSPPQPKRPGLQLRPGALATVVGETAVLTAGVLTYRHDATHEPGVRKVQIAEPPMVARPVGTAFSATANGGYAAVRVTEGEVWVERVDGRAVLPLRPGDEVLVFEGRDGLSWLATGGLALDEVVTAMPRSRSRDGRAVISMLASLRLASRETLEEAQVPFVLGGDL